MNVSSESVAHLVSLGYTPEEARFVYVVATHSGYFTHRQFLQFSGTKPGKHSQKFLAKLLAERHATHHTYASGGRVYHVFSRKIFGAMGRDDLRTRRKHELEYIKTRLVTLDFVLRNPTYEYLETEKEKVPYFENHLGLDRSIFPSKVYRSRRTGNATIRYFVDRFPMFLRAASEPVVFTYVDHGAASLRGFVTHLQSHKVLLRSLPTFEFLYLAPSDRFFRAAQVEFSRIVLASKEMPGREQVLRYFKLRKQWESGERVSAADVVFLNACGAEINDEATEQRYANWRDGRTKDAEVSGGQSECKRHIQSTFLTQVCGESLSVFRRGEATYGESSDEMPSDSFSPTLSPTSKSSEKGKREDATA
jgi:hypothetical protein